MLNLDSNYSNYTDDYQSQIEKTESPIEQFIFDRLFKFKNIDVQILVQETIITNNGIFRPDIILKKDDQIISIECDGKIYHKGREYYDEWRDLLIMLYSDIRSIFRLRGKDINNVIDNIIYFISQCIPDFFNQDLITRNLNAFNPEFIEYVNKGKIQKNNNIECLEYNDEDEITSVNYNIIWKKIENSFGPFEKRLVMIALLQPGVKIEELITNKLYDDVSTEYIKKLFYNKFPKKLISIMSE